MASKQKECSNCDGSGGWSSCRAHGSNPNCPCGSDIACERCEGEGFILVCSNCEEPWTGMGDECPDCESVTLPYVLPAVCA